MSTRVQCLARTRIWVCFTVRADDTYMLRSDGEDTCPNDKPLGKHVKVALLLISGEELSPTQFIAGMSRPITSKVEHGIFHSSL